MGHLVGSRCKLVSYQYGEIFSSLMYFFCGDSFM